MRNIIVWGVLVLVVAIPIGAAAMSPLLEWRDPVYIIAGFAGVMAMSLLLFQPMLAAGILPGLSALRGRRAHKVLGSALALLVTVHVAGLWVTSPPDVIDALLFVSPTPFSVWGVIAMWAVFAAVCLVVLRRKLRLRPRTWKLSHRFLVLVIAVGSVVHALLIEGTMETFSKWMLCVLIIVATVGVVGRLKLRA